MSHELSLEKREAFAAHLREKGCAPDEITKMCAALERALRQAAVAEVEAGERERVFAAWETVYAARQCARDKEDAALAAGEHE